MQPPVHRTTDSSPNTGYSAEEEEDLQKSMKFVAEDLDDILVLIRCGFIRLLEEWGEPALACVLSESFKNKLREKGREEQGLGKERLLLMKKIIEEHLANPDEADPTLGGYGMIRIGLCRLLLIRLCRLDWELQIGG